MDTKEAMNRMNEAKDTANQLTETAKRRFSDLSHKVADRSKQAASNTDAYVREYAWSSIALAALLGVVVGLMIRKS